MFKGRRGLLFAILLGLFLLLGAFLLMRGTSGGGFSLFGERKSDTPVELQRLIPARWEVIPGSTITCSFDADAEMEWLIIYRYDGTTVQDDLDPRSSPIERSLIGGVIFDAQPALVHEADGSMSPYRPTVLVPYKLLPDYYAGKGQGYLGESRAEVRQWPPIKRGQPCQTDEFYVFGFDDGPLPTRLSGFKWSQAAGRFDVAHLVGNARVAFTTERDGRLAEASTFNRLENHRSRLCQVNRFVRRESTDVMVVLEDPSSFTIDFCFDTPGDPAYPEGVVVALLRGAEPVAPSKQTPLPTGDSFLTQNAIVPPEIDLRSPNRAPMRVLSVEHRGVVSTSPAGGFDCTPPENRAGEGPKWWCGRERAEVLAETVVDGQPRRLAFSLMSISNQAVATDVVWRVDRADWE
jgi:hypothetical protein